MEKLSIEVVLENDGRAWINPDHIVKLVQPSPSVYIVHLSNGDTFSVSYSDANKIKEFFATRTI